MVKKAASILSAFLLTGCASLVPPKGPGGEIHSYPYGATVLDFEGEELGIEPQFLRFPEEFIHAGEKEGCWKTDPVTVVWRSGAYQTQCLEWCGEKDDIWEFWLERDNEKFPEGAEADEALSQVIDQKREAEKQIAEREKAQEEIDSAKMGLFAAMALGVIGNTMTNYANQAQLQRMQEQQMFDAANYQVQMDQLRQSIDALNNTLRQEYHLPPYP